MLSHTVIFGISGYDALFFFGLFVFKSVTTVTLLTISLYFQTYRRDGNDLFMNHKIGLVEALCGFQFMLKHLDGRQIVVKYPAGKVIEPGKHPFLTLLFLLN